MKKQAIILFYFIFLITPLSLFAQSEIMVKGKVLKAEIKDLVCSEVRYTANSGQQTVFNIPDIKSGELFDYRSVFLPPNGIDPVASERRASDKPFLYKYPTIGWRYLKNFDAYLSVELITHYAHQPSWNAPVVQILYESETSFTIDFPPSKKGQYLVLLLSNSTSA